MGVFKLLLNLGNAEGIRQAMRMAYKRGRSQHHITSRPHFDGLLAALGSRYLVNGVVVPEDDLWEECGPFFLVTDQEVAVDALAEYAVFKERPLDAKIDGLKHIINGAIEDISTADSGVRGATVTGFRAPFPWVQLLDDNARATLEAEHGRLRAEHEAWLASRIPVQCDTHEGKAALARAIKARRDVTLLRLGVSGPEAEETVTPHEMKFISGAECLIAFSYRRSSRAQFPLHLYSLTGGMQTVHSDATTGAGQPRVEAARRYFQTQRCASGLQRSHEVVRWRGRSFNSKFVAQPSPSEGLARRVAATLTPGQSQARALAIR